MDRDTPETKTNSVQMTAGAMPVRVECREGDDRLWVEISRLLNLTPRSATLNLTQEPKLGQLLHLTLPKVHRKSDKSGEPNCLWALVWALAETNDETNAETTTRHAVSVVFVGDEVPAGHEREDAVHFEYLIEDDGRFRLQRKAASAKGRDCRRESRMFIPVEVIIEALDAGGQVLAREHTVTENISRSGAAVWTTLDVEPKQLVRIKSDAYAVTLVSIVRARRLGPDGITRLHLEFTGGQWPLDVAG